MKKTKKAMSMILCMILLFTLFMPTAFANGESEAVYEVFFEEPGGFGSPEIEADASEQVDWTAVFDCLAQSIGNATAEINLTEFNIPYSDANYKTLCNFVWYHPQNLRCVSVFGVQRISKQIVKMTPTYKYNAEELQEMKAACEDVIATMLYGIRGNTALSDAQKCLLLHDRLATWCEYDYANYLTESIPEISYSAYGPLVLKVGVCEGIALANAWMLDELGIENYYETSDLLYHGWNMIYIDSEPYFLDITHDDVVWDRVGRVNHDFVLVSYLTYSKKHDYALDFSHLPTSTLYENAFWAQKGFCPAEVQCINDKLYYLEEQTIDSVVTARLMQQDCKTGEQTVLQTVSDKWYAYENTAYANKYCSLASIGSTLIYNTPTQIRTYDTQTGTDALLCEVDLSDYAEFTYIYGLTQKNGVIYYALNTTPTGSQKKPDTVLTYSYCTAHTQREVLTTLTPATCTVDGEAKYICKDCRAVFTDTVSKTGLHSYTQYVGVKSPATCMLDRVDTYQCICGLTTDITAQNTKTEHTDINGDGICDACFTVLKQNSCDCSCHKSGINGIFFKLKLFLWKLFNMSEHRYCACGKAHW